MPSVRFLTGDVLAVLKTLPADHFDAVLSDPPYGLSFMGKEWDRGVPSAEVYAELLRVLKPGAFGLHFGGTRTFHRLAVNLEDAGFEMKDCLSWLYGSGFPKSHNISKALDKQAGAEREVLGRNPNSREHCDASNSLYEPGTVGKTALVTAPATPAAVQWDGYGTALKPAWEPCLLVQKPLDKTFANNVLTHGCGGLNIDGSRVPGVLEGDPGRFAKTDGGAFVAAFSKDAPVVRAEGRFPANLILDQDAAEALDAATEGKTSQGHWPQAKTTGFGEFGGGKSEYLGTCPKASDKGGASRFFYTAKVSTKERNAGCQQLEPRRFETNQPYGQGADARAASNDAGSKNNHPTLKPLALTEYLARLLLVPARTDGKPRRILIPFSGAGSEAIGAALAGWDEVVGIELDPAYVAIAEARVAHWVAAERKAA